MKMYYSPASEAEAKDDSHGCDLREVNCELAMLEGEIVSIPYELYDLPDLREILSAKTWNSCLTDEERFSLSAYLPDMDQDTFMSTMKELFDGSNLHFGNPVHQFFERLRGGLYSPKVACLRNCLHFLQRKKYYCSLKSYHQNMVRAFRDMACVWGQLEKESNCNERLNVWLKWKKRQQLDMLDLNMVPMDGSLSGEEANVHDRRHFIDRTNVIEHRRSSNNSSSFSLDCRPFVTMEMQESKNYMHKAQGAKATFSELQRRSVPKGLLKVVPKVPAVQLDTIDMIPRNQRQRFLIDSKCLIDDTSVVPNKSSRDIVKSPSLDPKLGSSNVSKGTQLPECVLNRQDSMFRGIEDTSAGWMKEETDQLPGDTITSKQQLFCRNQTNKIESRLASSRILNDEATLRSLEQWPSDVRNQLPEQCPWMLSKETTSVNSRLCEAPAKIFNVNNSTGETGSSSCSKPKKGNQNVYVRKASKLQSKNTESKGTNTDVHLFPLTYKRRKHLSKV